MFVKKFTAAAAAAILSLLIASPAAAQSVTNGGFETGNTSGWTTSSGPFVLNTSSYPSSTSDGNYFLWLGGRDSQNTSISQVVSGLTVGQTYSLSFLMASEYTTQDSLRASVNGTGTIFSAPAAIGSGWNNWVQQSLLFTALTTSATIQFDTIGISSYNRYDVGLDKVTLSAVSGVPEPATWAMMLLGFGGIGAALRRQRKPTRLAQVA